MLGVSVDPRGDTPAYVNAFIAGHGMTGHLEYLLGTRRQLAPVWREYAVAVLPDPGTDVVGHAAVLYGITASGQRLTVYSANNFTPQMIVHDVPLLAAR
jgi:protein SCO1